jgi:hypothetical protein
MEEGGAEVCIRTYDDGDFVRHNCKYLTSKVRDKEGRINCTAIKVLFGNQSVVDGKDICSGSTLDFSSPTPSFLPTR